MEEGDTATTLEEDLDPNDEEGVPEKEGEGKRRKTGPRWRGGGRSRGRPRGRGRGRGRPRGSQKLSNEEESEREETQAGKKRKRKGKENVEVVVRETKKRKHIWREKTKEEMEREKEITPLFESKLLVSSRASRCPFSFTLFEKEKKTKKTKKRVDSFGLFQDNLGDLFVDVSISVPSTLPDSPSSDPLSSKLANIVSLEQTMPLVAFLEFLQKPQDQYFFHTQPIDLEDIEKGESASRRGAQESLLGIFESFPSIIRPLGPYDAASFCGDLPEHIATYYSTLQIGQCGSNVGMSCSHFGSLTSIVCLKGKIRIWIVPSREDLLAIFKAVMCREKKGLFLPPSVLSSLSCVGLKVWEEELKEGGMCVFPANMCYQMAFEKEEEGDKISTALVTSFSHVDLMAIEEEREATLKMHGFGLDWCTKRVISWRALLLNTLSSLSTHLSLAKQSEEEEEGNCRRMEWKGGGIWCLCGTKGKRGRGRGCIDRIEYLQPLFCRSFRMEDDVDLNADPTKDVESRKNHFTSSKSPFSQILEECRRCGMCGYSLLNSYYSCSKCQEYRTYICGECVQTHPHSLFFHRTLPRDDFEEISTSLISLLKECVSHFCYACWCWPCTCKVEERGCRRREGKEGGEGEEQPSQVSLSSELPAPFSSTLPIPFSAVFSDWQCHKCGDIRSQFVVCPKSEEHCWCHRCLRTIGIEYPAIEENTSEFWPSGCPVCTDSCPCLRCLTHRTALPLPPSLADDITPLRTLVDDLLNSHLQQYGPFPKKRHPNSQPVRYVDPQEWKRDDFIESVIHGGVPVVLKGFSNDWDPKLWSLEYLRQHASDSKLWVRYQAIHPNHPAPYRVLKDQKKTVGWYLDVIQGNIRPTLDYEWVGGEEDGGGGRGKRREAEEGGEARAPISKPISRPTFELDFQQGDPTALPTRQLQSQQLSQPQSHPPSQSSSSSSSFSSHPPPYSPSSSQTSSKRLKSSECVCVYAKDFLFQQALPEWMKDMDSKLPSYLKTEGKEDMLHYPPKSQRPITLMAYIGGTHSRTPLHVDKLNTVAFNIHVTGGGVKRWWMIDRGEKWNLEKLLRKGGGHLHTDDTWCDPEVLESSGLKLWVVEQQQGDMVIVPPGVPHQVMNEGHSLAVAANVMNEHTLKLNWEMDKNYRRLKTDSIYRLKTLVYFGLKEEIGRAEQLLSGNRDKGEEDFDGKDLKKKLEELHPIFLKMISEERVPGIRDDAIGEPCNDDLPHTRTCDICRGDIFNRRFHCGECGADEREGYDLCVQCYISDGQEHQHRMYLVQVFPISHLHDLSDRAEKAISALPNK